MRHLFPWLLLLASLVAVMVLGVAFGSLPLGIREVLGALLGTSDDPATRTIVWDWRLPRVLLAALMGAALGASGAAFQALFRNPLADPFVVGASSGAAVGATAAILVGLGSIPLGAFLGTLGAVGLAYLVAGVGRLPAATLLLAGVAVSTILGSMVWLMLAISGERVPQIVGWLMGGLSGRSWPEVTSALPLIGIGVGGLWLMARPLDAVVCGEESARALGLRTGVTFALVLLFASLATAASVAVGGILGFVGLAAPHVARKVVGAAHIRVIPASAILGSMLVILADLAARSLTTQELPLGPITSFVGGPLFLWVLRSQLRRLAGGAV